MSLLGAMVLSIKALLPRYTPSVFSVVVYTDGPVGLLRV
jgi:hypothetical protein